MMKAGNFVNMSLVIQKELDIYNQKRMALKCGQSGRALR